MAGLVYALVLMGCSDAGDQCQTLETSSMAFTSRVSCEASIAAALESDAALRADHPTVVARCEAQQRTSSTAHLQRQGRSAAQRAR